MMKHENQKIILSIVVTTLLLLVVLISKSVYAKSSTKVDQKNQSIQKCYAMDVIFLIDQSNSMSGIDANDKFNNRIEAYKIAVEWLAQNQYSMCPDAIHRIGVISFGSDVDVDLELKEIPENQDTWEAIRTSLTDTVDVKQMGNTDHALAFKAAKEMLDRNPAPDSASDIPRKTSIIMVTDGRPCVPGKACDSGRPMELYLEALEEQINKDFPFSDTLLSREAAIRKQVSIYGDFNLIPEEVMSIALSENEIREETDFANSTYIYILALNDAYPYLEEVGETFTEITQSHGGDLIDLSNNTSEIPLQFNEVLSRLSMVKISKGRCGSLYVQPYLSALTVNVYKSVEGVPVTIYYGEPSTAVYELEEGKGDTQAFGSEITYSLFGPTNESYNFISPKGGEWYIDAAISVCGELRVVYQTFLPQDFQLVEPSHTLPVFNSTVTKADYNADNPYYLSYSIQDINRHSYLISDPDYPLSIKVEITAPDTAKKYTNLEYIPGKTIEDGRWVSVDPLPVSQLGEYKVAIVSATAPCVDPKECTIGSTFEVFGENTRLGEGTYTTSDVAIFDFLITNPEPGMIVPVHQSITKKLVENPLNFQIKLIDENGQPISYQEIFGTASNVSNIFSASLLIDGTEIKKDINFISDPLDDSVLNAEVAINNATLKGAANLSIALIGDYDYDNYLVKEKSKTVNFTRKDTFLYNPLFWYALFIFLGVIIFLIIIWFFYHRSRALTGYLEFSPNQNEGSVISLPISKKWDTTKIKLPVILGGSMAKIKNLGGKNSEILIAFTYKGEKRRISLKPGQQKSMPPGIPYLVRYIGAVKKENGYTGMKPKYDPYAK